jgi:hypothetical protein
LGGKRGKKKGREIAAFPKLQDDRLAVLFAAVRSTLSIILFSVPARRERGGGRLTHLTALTGLTTLTARLLATALPWVIRVVGFHKSLL